MACGAAVVASDVGGIPDLLDGGDAGRLVKVGDRSALHEAVTALIDDPTLRETLAGRARRAASSASTRRARPRGWSA